VSLYEITAAVAMTGILAAVAVPVVIDRVAEARVVRAVQEVDTISKAIASFQQDTGKIPGEMEHFVLLASKPDALPTLLGGVTCTTGEGGNCGDLNNFLVKKPAGLGYANWKGPYMDTRELDPFEKSYIVNVKALHTVDTDSLLGFGWILSSGPDQTVDTAFADSKVADDDIGKNHGKKVSAIRQ
jgi:hypothetical protein